MNKDSSKPVPIFLEGDKVTYYAGYGKPERGIVKSITIQGIFVVYNCANEWDDYKNYTAALTDPDKLQLGWKEEPNQETCDHYFIPSGSKWQPIHQMACQWCGKIINN